MSHVHIPPREAEMIYDILKDAYEGVMMAYTIKEKGEGAVHTSSDVGRMFIDRVLEIDVDKKELREQGFELCCNLYLIAYQIEHKDTQKLHGVLTSFFKEEVDRENWMVKRFGEQPRIAEENSQSRSSSKKIPITSPTPRPE